MYLVKHLPQHVCDYRTVCAFCSFHAGALWWLLLLILLEHVFIPIKCHNSIQCCVVFSALHAVVNCGASVWICDQAFIFKFPLTSCRSYLLFLSHVPSLCSLWVYFKHKPFIWFVLEMIKTPDVKALPHELLKNLSSEKKLIRSSFWHWNLHHHWNL